VEVLFWICALLVAYPYAIYPVVLVAINRLGGRRAHAADVGYEPAITVIMPVHNEAGRIGAKVANLLALDYPREKMQILVIGDGCTDDTLDRALAAGQGIVTVVPLAGRGGKAAGLNAGLERATGDIVVFTDAGIMLDRLSLRYLVGHFTDPQVGCVSGEDYIEGSETEGLYGKLELLLRREEARLHSIAGASGCFYGQRRELCEPFQPGMAPDFLSVLNTVRQGKRALAEPLARGSMTATSSQRAEFTRKVRTFLRGITALFGSAGLLNPFRYPAFSFILWSHKLMRWLAPLPMVGCLVAAYLLRAQLLYLSFFIIQVVLYLAAVAGMLWPQLAARLSVVRLSAFFVLVNAAALKALALWLVGSRVEVWQPTQRPK
jgi:cellulose synthase/poly-beta-1,6-N-acetylglucosamine synthase-like glycosyltransferase